MSKGKGVLDSFTERDGQLTIQKEVSTNNGIYKEVPHRSQMDRKEVGADVLQDDRRRKLAKARAEQGAPELLQRQEQTPRKTRRPRRTNRRNNED